MAEKNMNAKISVEFEEAANRQQLSSGDNLPALFGKIKKIISDLSTSAFSGSYNDLSDTPEIPTITIDTELSDTSENAVQNKVIKAELDKKLESDDLPEAKNITNEASGEVITVTDAVEEPLLGLNVYGKSTQDGTPSPSNPVPIVSVGDDGELKVTSCGKNLYEGSQDFSGEWINSEFWTTAAETYNGLVVKKSVRPWAGLSKILSVKPNIDYAFSVYAKSDADTAFTMYVYDENGVEIAHQTLAVGTDWNRIDFTFNTGNNTVIMPRVDLREQLNGYICGYQLEESPKMTDYEPYTGSTAAITSVLPLCGLPVTDGGNYTDNNGLQWACDELIYNSDGTGKVVKRTVSYTFDGSEDEKWALSAASRRLQAFFSSKKIKPSPSASKAAPLLCNRAVSVSANDTWAGTKEGFSIGAEAEIGICIIALKGNTDLSVWTSYLAENPYTVVFELATPEEINLTAEEMAQLKQLYSYNGVTNIFNDEGAEMSVKYWCDNSIANLLENKANVSDLTSHTGNKSNPHSVTKAQVGLGNVENKSSATIRSEITKANVTDALGYTPPETDTTYTLSSFGITATATELNYCDGVTSNIQTQLNGKAASSHMQAYTASECTEYNSDDNTMGVTPAAVRKAFSVFEPKSHTHTTSQITNFPSSLPANGGNADTAKGTTTTILGYGDNPNTILDWANNTNSNSHSFVISGYGIPSDSPFSEEAVISSESDNNGRKVITWKSYTSAKVLQRRIWQGAWQTEWYNPANGCNADTVDGKHVEETVITNNNNWVAVFDNGTIRCVTQDSLNVKNADTVDGLHADDFVKSDCVEQFEIPAGVDIVEWLGINAKKWTRYYTNNTNYTNIPQGGANGTHWIWYYFDGINFYAREHTTNYFFTATRINNEFSGWQIQYTSTHKPYVTGMASITTGNANTVHDLEVLNFTPSAVICRQMRNDDLNGKIMWATPITNGFSIVTDADNTSNVIQYIAFR